MRVRAVVEYLGTALSGWQYQPDTRTVQGELEEALFVATRHRTRIAAAGRTDAGVHALGQVIAFDVPSGVDLRRLRLSLDALTGRDITVVSLEIAHEGFDPRREALRRTYRYTIVNGRPASPFLADRSWTIHRPLDERRLDECARQFVGEHDFSAFRSADCESRSTRRTVYESSWKRDGHLLEYTVTANAFLKQMVRTMVGTMIDIEIERLPPQRLAALLGGGSRESAGRTAPAQGLTFVRVDYPDR